MNRVLWKRMTLLALAALAPCALVVVWTALTLQPGLPAGAQRVVDSYRRSREDAGGESTAVQGFSRAEHPSQFRVHMSRASWGDDGWFQTTHGDSGGSGASAPVLPYPPSDAWCVVVASRVLVVTLHEDQWHTEWVVHEPTDAASPDFARLGCTVPASR